MLRAEFCAYCVEHVTQIEDAIAHDLPFLRISFLFCATLGANERLNEGLRGVRRSADQAAFKARATGAKLLR